MNNPDEKVQLLPCPFCGGKAKLILQEGIGQINNWYDIACETTNCFLQYGADWYLPEEDVIDLWNWRINAKTRS